MTPADATEAMALAEEAEAEAAEAEAVAAAARARARAIRLRRQAETSKSEEAQAEEAVVEETDTEQAEDEETEAEETTPAPARGRQLRPWRWMARRPEVDIAPKAAPLQAARTWRRRLGWKALAASVSVLCTIGLLAAGGWMVWNHRQADAYHQRQVEFAAAARQSVVTLMTLDYTHARDDVQRVIDNTTGQFKQDFQSTADSFTHVAQDSKVITEATVNDTAVESMTDDSALVLVSATSRVTNAAGAKQEPRTWRLSVIMKRDGDQIKLAKAEFVP